MSAIVAVAQCFLLTPAAFAGNVIYVDQSATGPLHDGSTWCDAYVDLQDALAVANGGDEIYVANGNYVPDRGTDDRAASFQLINGVGIFGGFAGCGASDPNVRDVLLYESVLSGDLLSDDLHYANELDCINAGGVWYGVLCDKIGNNDENAFHVVVSTSNNATAVLDGFTVSGGHADGPGLGPTPDSQEQGSGINIYFGNPSLANCIVENNRTFNHGAINDHGGATLLNCELRWNFSTRWGAGLHNHANIATSATDCRFFENATEGTAGGGGGMFVKGQPTLTGCVFSGNVSATNGGAMYNAVGAVATAIDCAFTENSAVRGGAIYNTGIFSTIGAVPILTNCTITGNTATEFGGGMFSFRRCHGVLTGCTFRANTAATGGAIYLNDFCDPTLDACAFIDNQAIGPDVGSGYVGGGGIWMQGGTSPVISDTLFINNTATTGGGAIYSSFSTSAGPSGGPKYTNCQFFGNTADYGGVIANYRDNTSFTNCVFTGNFAFGTTSRGGGGVVNDTQDGGTTGLVGTTLIHCTVSGNSSNGAGGAVFLKYPFSIFTLTNSIFWDNVHFGGILEESGQIYDRTREEFNGFDPAVVTVHHTLLRGWTGFHGGVGNFGTDPLFVDENGDDNIVGTVDDDLRLRANSPAINAGDNSAVPVGVTTDLGGNPRILNGIVDLGAYEFLAICGDGGCDAAEGPCTCPADCGDPPAGEIPGSSCADGEDNDCDAVTDCEDSDCATECATCGDGNCDTGEGPCSCAADCGDPPSSEVPGSSCADGEDNDCDTMTDCTDPDCAIAAECQVCGDGSCHVDESPCNCPVDCGDPPSNEVPGVSCTDHDDNDCDGVTDCADPDCEAPCPIPAVSAWGACCMMLLLLTAGSLVVRGREHT